MGNEVHQVDQPQGFAVICAGDPNGAITAPKGTVAYDNVTPAVWQNTNGVTTWVQIGTGGGGITSWGLETEAAFSGAGDPNGIVTALSAGDVYDDTDGALWIATAPGDTNWVLVGPGATAVGTGANTFLDDGDHTGATTISFGAATVHRVRLTGNVTFTFTGPTAGQADDLTLYLVQDGSGSRTVTWPASVVWAYGIVPTLSTTAAATDVVVLETFDGGTTWFANLAGKSYA